MVAGTRKRAVQSRAKWQDSASSSNAEPAELTGRLDVVGRRKREVRDDSRDAPLSNWKESTCHFLKYRRQGQERV